jgi:hypothetical protein
MKFLSLLFCLPICIFAQDLPDQEVESRGRQRIANPTAIRPDIRGLLPAVAPLQPKAPLRSDSLQPLQTKLSLGSSLQNAPVYYPASTQMAYAGVGQYLSRKIGGMVEFEGLPKFRLFAQAHYDGAQGFGAVANQSIQAKRNALKVGGGATLSGNQMNTLVSLHTAQNKATQYQMPTNSLATPGLQYAPNKQESENGFKMQLQNAACNPLQFSQVLGITQYAGTTATSREAATQFSVENNETRYQWQPRFVLPLNGFKVFANGNLSQGKVQDKTVKDALVQVETGMKWEKSPLLKLVVGFAVNQFKVRNAASNAVLHQRNYYLPIFGVESVLSRNVMAFFKHEPITQIRTAQGFSTENPFLVKMEQIRPQISPIHFKGGVVLGTQTVSVGFEGSYEKADETPIFKATNLGTLAYGLSYAQAQIYSVGSHVKLRFSEQNQAFLRVTLREGKQSNLSAPNRLIPFFSPLLLSGGFQFMEPQTSAVLSTNFHIENKAPITENSGVYVKPFMNFESRVEIPVYGKIIGTMTLAQQQHRYEGINNSRRNPAVFMIGAKWKE